MDHSFVKVLDLQRVVNSSDNITIIVRQGFTKLDCHLGEELVVWVCQITWIVQMLDKFQSAFLDGSHNPCGLVGWSVVSDSAYLQFPQKLITSNLLHPSTLGCELGSHPSYIYCGIRKWLENTSKIFIHLFVCLIDSDSARLLSFTRVSYKLIYICSPCTRNLTEKETVKKLKMYPNKIDLSLWICHCTGQIPESEQCPIFGSFFFLISYVPFGMEKKREER